MAHAALQFHDDCFDKSLLLRYYRILKYSYIVKTFDKNFHNQDKSY